MRELEHGHDSASIRRRLAAGPPVSYLRDWVYGGIDGAVTTFAIVAGAVGADLSPRVELALSTLINLVGDGFSMAAGDFSATKAERDEYALLRAVEERHVDLVPEGEREEVRQIYRAKGFRGEDLERAVSVITASRKGWIDTMMAEEYSQPKVLRLPCYQPNDRKRIVGPTPDHLTKGGDRFVVATGVVQAIGRFEGLLRGTTLLLVCFVDVRTGSPSG